jgi:cytochrome P450
MLFADPPQHTRLRAQPRRESPSQAVGNQRIEYCIGAALARMEATIALPRLLARIPEMSLEIPASKLTWRKSLLIRGLTTLTRVPPP